MTGWQKKRKQKPHSMKEILFKNGKILSCTKESFEAIADALNYGKEFVFIHLSNNENQELVSVIRTSEIAAMYSNPTN